VVRGVDLAFHTLALSLVDFDFAKEQLLLMLRTLYSHPNGQMPAYEWNFSDVNPPVHAWATLYLYKVEKNLGREDVKFLERSFQGLMLNFNWWVNRKDPQGRNVFAGGFLGLDNIGVFDRSAQLPTGGSLEQADAPPGWRSSARTCWRWPSSSPRRTRTTRRSPSSSSRTSSGSPTRWTRSANGRRHVGRGGRVLLRRAAAARRPGVPLEGPLDGRPAAAVREHRLRAGDGDAPPEADGADRAVQETPPQVVAHVAPTTEGLSATRTPAAFAPLEREAHAHPLVPPGRAEFLGRTGSDRFRGTTRSIRSSSTRAAGIPGRVSAGRVEQRHVRGELELARAVWMPVNALIVRGLINFYGFYGDDFTVECPTGRAIG